MRDWQAGRRRNDPHDLMGRVARRMTDDDIRAVALYFQSLRPGESEARAKIGARALDRSGG
jgi:cytochrome c553